MSSIEPAPQPMMPPNQAAYHDPYLPTDQPPPYTHTQFVVTTQPASAPRVYYYQLPVRTICPHCNSDIMTAIDYRVGGMVYVACIILIIMGCVIGCCLIPFCYHGAKDVYHTCPNCKKELGCFKRM